MKYMSKTKWIVFNDKLKKVKTVTLKHKDGAHYKEIEPFEKELIEQGLVAYDAEMLEQDYLKGKPYKERLRILGFV